MRARWVLLPSQTPCLQPRAAEFWSCICWPVASVHCPSKGHLTWHRSAVLPSGYRSMREADAPKHAAMQQPAACTRDVIADSQPGVLRGRAAWRTQLHALDHARRMTLVSQSGQVRSGMQQALRHGLGPSIRGRVWRMRGCKGTRARAGASLVLGEVT